MHFKEGIQWLPITEEEYNKAKPKETSDELWNAFNSVLFNMIYRKDPIYKNPGLHNLLEDNPEIIGYDYYKEGSPILYMCCTLEEAKKFDKQICELMLKEYGIK